MPAKSQSQRALIFARFGSAWAKKHGFDNPGPLPKHVGTKPGKHRAHYPLSDALKKRGMR